MGLDWKEWIWLDFREVTKVGSAKYLLPNNNLKRCEANPNFCLTHGLRVLWRLATYFESRLFKQLPKVVKLYNFLG